MLTKLDVANLALGHLGSSHQIINLDTETTNIAKIVRRHYEMSQESLLSEHPWYVFTKRAALTLLSNNPSLDWLYEYGIPDDCIVIRRLSDSNLFMNKQEYQDELLPFEPIFADTGYTIYTNVYQAWAEYTKRPADNSGMPIHYVRALSWQLAIDIGPSIITNNYASIKKVLLDNCKIEISKQMAIDISLRPEPIASDSPFIRARNGA